jgi:hypothetical protein
MARDYTEEDSNKARAYKFYQRAVAHELDDTTRMGRYRGVDKVSPNCF